MSNLFFDTEFTNLDSQHEPFLISIGLVAEDGREFYAELTDNWTREECSDFVIQTVLPMLSDGDRPVCPQDCRMTREQLAHNLKTWIEQLGTEVLLRSDAPRYDWPLIAELFQFYGCWPENLLRKCGAIYFDEDEQAHRYNVADYEFGKAYADLQHHALIDARSILFSWREAMQSATN